ncbi:FecR family protein [Acinetobacter puyangensis]|uniref:FecR family protein n=1 Tax=Acinetobacter puyangensis TaxID=1096779 RepID=A0A240EEB6_9GAMM|nr:FecR domain-containing protein [Acinetobacter puyangensis]SNX46613.1 FecR family protein [Acinetobacter puyangensis]
MIEPDQPQPDVTDSKGEDELLQQVAEWLVKMSDEDCSEEDRQAFLAWQNQNPHRRQLVEQVQATLQQFTQIQHSNSQQLSTQIIEDTLNDDSLNHRGYSSGMLRSVMIFLCSGLIIALMAWQMLPMHDWLADRRNAYNQWTVQSLSDRSEINISGKTAYDIDFDQAQRLIKLFNGNILVDVAKDAQRPFVIETKYARITALGTRFIVQHYEHATILMMLESKTSVELSGSIAGSTENIVVEAGQQVIIDAQGIHPSHQISPELLESAWQKRMLVIHQMPLDQVLGILQSYQNKRLSYDDKQLQHIIVNATLPLDGDALQLLQQSLPIEVQPDFLGRVKITEKK